jgi:DNA helicase-2/ATP-dependent DNA helicase PcrA
MIKRHLALIPKEVAGQILYYFFEDSGLLGYYLDPRSAKTERQAQNIANFFERLQSFAAENRDASVFAVVDWIDLSMELGESPLAAETDWTENNAVNILTVHSSKGLEFPVVFVVNLVMQRFPSRDRKEQIPIPQELIKEQLPETDENLQEERRLFYVAMTRARDKLYLTAAKSYGEGKRERKLSPFVYEALGETYVNKILEREKVEQASEQLSLLEVLKPIAKSKDENDSKDLSLAAFPKTYTVDYISYSQIQTFDVCPLHYKLKYILKFPSPPSPALSFGITIHALLKTIYQLGFGRQKISEEMLDRLIDEFWRGEGYSSKAHEQAAKKSAKQILLSYMAHNAQEGRLPEATELSFQFMLNDRLKVLGRFDRIDKLEGNTIEIIDYKTGENVPDERKLNTDLQLSLYALAATMLNDDLFRKKPEEILLTLYYVEKNKRLSTVRTKEQLEEAKELILKKVDEITHSDFRCRGGMICENCEYKILCSTYASK